MISFSSLHYPKKERRNKADFLHADKHQTFLQVDTINLGGYGQVCPITQNNKFAKSLRCPKILNNGSNLDQD